jgi:cytochrome P450
MAAGPYNKTDISILKHLWGVGRQSAREIHDALEAETGWSYSTTRTLLSSGLLLLLQHPEALAALRADPSLVPSAVEEMLRFESPLNYFRRTATRDTRLGGAPIREGDAVAMLYTSANRDEDVFPNADRFDVHRTPNPHLAFGIGEHFCLGAALARLEARVFFEELLAAFPRIELTGAPRRQRSNLNNALKSLPVRLLAA